jgi:hypothetical protein
MLEPSPSRFDRRNDDPFVAAHGDRSAHTTGAHFDPDFLEMESVGAFESSVTYLVPLKPAIRRRVHRFLTRAPGGGTHLRSHPPAPIESFRRPFGLAMIAHGLWGTGCPCIRTRRFDQCIDRIVKKKGCWSIATWFFFNKPFLLSDCVAPNKCSGAGPISAAETRDWLAMAAGGMAPTCRRTGVECTAIRSHGSPADQDPGR